MKMSPGPYLVNTRFTPLPWGWYPLPELCAVSGYQPQGWGVNQVFTSYGPGNLLLSSINGKTADSIGQ